MCLGMCLAMCLAMCLGTWVPPLPPWADRNPQIVFQYFFCFLVIFSSRKDPGMQRVTVRYMQESFILEINEGDTVEALKKKIAERIQVLPERQRLTHRGSALADTGKTMKDLGIDSNAVIYVSRSENSSATEGIRKEICSRPETLSGIPQQGFPKASEMRKIFSNPEVMKGILEMFPEMKKENPELKKIMESSQMVEEMAKFAEDPEYMNIQTKNIDIAMAKLETIPGGFNMLRNTLKVQRDPSASAAEGGDGVAFKEGTTDARDARGPVPNPWSTYNFNPIVAYRRQVEYMRECGFTDIAKNITLLIKHHGDVDEAITDILSSAVHSPVADTESRG